jgi:hypothetical protein
MDAKAENVSKEQSTNCVSESINKQQILREKFHQENISF